MICSFPQIYFSSGTFSYRTSPGTSVPRKTFGNTKLDRACVSCPDGTLQAFYFLLMVSGLALDLLSYHHHLFLMTTVSLLSGLLEDTIWSNNFSLSSCLWNIESLGGFLNIFIAYSNKKWKIKMFSPPILFILFSLFISIWKGEPEHIRDLK